MKTKIIIMKTSIKMFMEYGIQAVSVDDICREIGISKKTLYKEFSTRDELNRKSLEYFFDNMEISLSDKIKARVSENPETEELFTFFFTLVAEQFTSINTKALEQMEYKKPEIWRLVQTRRHHLIGTNLKLMLDYAESRNEINPQLPRELIISIVATLIREQATPTNIIRMNMTPVQFIESLASLLTKGILTNKEKK